MWWIEATRSSATTVAAATGWADPGDFGMGGSSYRGQQGDAEHNERGSLTLNPVDDRSLRSERSFPAVVQRRERERRRHLRPIVAGCLPARLSTARARWTHD